MEKSSCERQNRHKVSDKSAKKKVIKCHLIYNVYSVTLFLNIKSIQNINNKCVMTTRNVILKH